MGNNHGAIWWCFDWVHAGVSHSALSDENKGSQFKPRHFMVRTALASLGLTLMASIGNADSPIVHYPENGHWYQRVDVAMTWHQAKAYCESAGGHLATVTSQSENDFVYGNLGVDGTTIWLGATDEETEGVWRWVTGEAWDYTNWGGSQPDDWRGGQDYLEYWHASPGKWDDAGGPNAWEQEFTFMCEWETNPRPRIRSITRSDEVVQLSIDRILPGTTNYVESTNALESNEWSVMDTFIGPALGLKDWSGTAPSGATRMFYRIRSVQSAP